MNIWMDVYVPRYEDQSTLLRYEQLAIREGGSAPPEKDLRGFRQFIMQSATGVALDPRAVGQAQTRRGNSCAIATTAAAAALEHN
ncbi:hypothetical protein J6590_042513 [Homalodisca vitripennis]|nr:hypothetical protein J6590_042513 [Homalodisca vitripennis]